MKTIRESTAAAKPPATANRGATELTTAPVAPCLPELTPAERQERARLEGQFKAASVQP
jgi:hypothetical protein